MSVNHPTSPDAFSSLCDSKRHEFFSSGRVMSSPTPTPLSETTHDFQLTCDISTRLLSPVTLTPHCATIGCRCDPGCMKPCCTSRGWATGNRNMMTSTGLPNMQGTVGDGVKMNMSSADAAGGDNISVGSNDSGSDTPLLPFVERHRFGNTSAIVS